MCHLAFCIRLIIGSVMPKVQYIAELAARRWRTSPLAGSPKPAPSVGDSLQKSARAPSYSEGALSLLFVLFFFHLKFSIAGGSWPVC